MEWKSGSHRYAPVRRLEICWKLHVTGGRILTCNIDRNEGRDLEVRVGFGDEDLLWSQRTTDMDSARELAETWRQAIVAKGGVTELPVA